jgi:3-phosphoshikimate 1-carboxyvinyltransferase
MAGLTDEVPVLAVLASRADGTSIFRQVGNLRSRDQDRVGHLARSLRGLGIEAEVRSGDQHVQGSKRPPAGRVETMGDPRLTVAFTVLARVAGASIQLSETAAAEMSHPSFCSELDRKVSHD